VSGFSISNTDSGFLSIVTQNRQSNWQSNVDIKRNLLGLDGRILIHKSDGDPHYSAVWWSESEDLKDWFTSKDDATHCAVLLSTCGTTQKHILGEHRSTRWPEWETCLLTTTYNSTINLRMWHNIINTSFKIKPYSSQVSADSKSKCKLLNGNSKSSLFRHPRGQHTPMLMC
jgi:hypothetical protein